MIIFVIVPAFVSMVLSIGLMFSGMPNAEFYSLYVGLWVPSILSYGILLCVADKK
jgi:hypothetical protein